MYLYREYIPDKSYTPLQITNTYVSCGYTIIPANLTHRLRLTPVLHSQVRCPFDLEQNYFAVRFSVLILTRSEAEYCGCNY